MSSDKSPAKNVQNEFQEWKRGYGIQLRIKNIPSISTMTPVLIYFLHNNSKDILETTYVLMLEDYMLEEED